MNKSVFSELWYKMVHSGSRLYLFMGINVIVFFAFGILSVVEFLFSGQTPLNDWIVGFLKLPSYLPSFIFQPWGLFTYMFLHSDLFHFLFNMLALYWLGQIYEDYTNARQFTFTYLGGGLFGGFLFVLFYNIFPAFQGAVLGSTLVGASASVLAIIVGAGTLLPDFSIRLLLFGNIQLKYLVLIYVLINIVAITGLNAGGAIAHLGGALFGFLYIRQLQAGNDWSKLFNNRRRLKVIRNDGPGAKSSAAASVPDDEVIDQILDKISKSGYQSLSRQEKELLFKASKKQ